jgi:hypothetical protein
VGITETSFCPCRLFTAMKKKKKGEMEKKDTQFFQMWWVASPSITSFVTTSFEKRKLYKLISVSCSVLPT